ncbi:ABC transporter ATP-binding protein [Alicyclobacillus sp. SO9]|uniref:oligopeptide/dipeptide ABC transporter ATP-binding protein n=1 Tax=Alicyclobacillus sp. SO9 TaxID=2665646 RepID=UPI0018E7C7AB|nr:ABC transporter ATP-binding protein [Alicyclobacillus sp. SO9]QQE80549.1 ABC transporter ATP-binding protein [Alicyclobacillus sp. SO9]
MAVNNLNDSGKQLVKLEELTKVFSASRGDFLACDHVNLQVQQGTSLGIVGESGSGKSTLVRLMQLLIPSTSGKVILNGIDVTRLPERRLKPYRKMMQFVQQDPYGSLFPHFTVAKNITEPLRIHKSGNKLSRLELALQLIDRVGLSPKQFHLYPHELSGGQQQRVAIAQALSLNPEMLILDEAVSSLDVSIQAQILNLLQGLKEEFGLTYVFISHNLSVIRLMCEETAVMYSGRVVETGESQELFRNPLHPYTQFLISSIPAFTDSGVTPLPEESIALRKRPSRSESGELCPYHTRCPFAQDRCRSERPVLREIVPGRFAACHFAEDVATAKTGQCRG